MTLHVKESRPISPEEEILYNGGMVCVTKRRLVVNDDSFDLRGVKGVEIRSTDPRSEMQTYIVAMVVAMAMVIFVLLEGTSSNFDYWSFNMLDVAVSFCWGLTFLAFIGALAVVLWKIRQQSRSKVYTLMLRRTFGLQAAVTSLDNAYLENNANAARYAIALNSNGAAVRPDYAATAQPPRFSITADGIISGAKIISLDTAASASISAVRPAGPLKGNALLLGISTQAIARSMDNRIDFPGAALLWSTLSFLGICAVTFWLFSLTQAQYIITIRKSTHEDPEAIYVAPSIQEAKKLKTDIERAIQGSTPALREATL